MWLMRYEFSISHTPGNLELVLHVLPNADLSSVSLLDGSIAISNELWCR